MVIKSWCDLTIDGRVYFENEVMSVTFTDKAGTQSDQLSVTLLPTIARPKAGAKVTCIFYNDLGQILDCGIFYVQSSTRSNNKDLIFSATGVEFNKKQKEKISQNYENTHLKDIVELVAQRLGQELKFQTQDQLVESIYQTDETDIHFLDRLSMQYDVLFSIKSDIIYFVNKGDTALPSYVINAEKCSSISVKYSIKKQYKSCEISYYDRKIAEYVKVNIESGLPVLKVKCPCKTKEEAELKGKARLARTQRGTVSGNLTSVGQEMYAGTKLQLINTYNREDDGFYSIESASHRYNANTGWVVSVDFENFKL